LFEFRARSPAACGGVSALTFLLAGIGDSSLLAARSFNNFSPEFIEASITLRNAASLSICAVSVGVFYGILIGFTFGYFCRKLCGFQEIPKV